MSKQLRAVMEHGDDLFSICLRMHMNNTGSSDPLSKEEKSYCYSVLTTALIHWEESHKFSKLFDDAVKNLIEVTLVESAVHGNMTPLQVKSIKKGEDAKD